MNYTLDNNGKSSAICYCCARKSRPVAIDRDGEPDLWQMPGGWSQAPYPAAFKHDDGSIGSTYTCPAYNARLRRGETLQRHASRATRLPQIDMHPIPADSQTGAEHDRQRIA